MQIGHTLFKQNTAFFIMNAPSVFPIGKGENKMKVHMIPTEDLHDLPNAAERETRLPKQQKDFIKNQNEDA